ncbi:MAG: hypothetical protein QE570_13300, partial [Verrucomicrobiota bacterium]|nr:hypothetical protein [Verrucomicrobiota bacterium]
ELEGSSQPICHPVRIAIFLIERMRSIKKTTPDQNITKSPKHKLSDMPSPRHFVPPICGLAASIRGFALPTLGLMAPNPGLVRPYRGLMA